MLPEPPVQQALSGLLELQERLELPELLVLLVHLVLRELSEPRVQ